jgi:hypothetical protein
MKKILIGFLLLLNLFVGIDIVYGAGVAGYQPLTPIPGLSQVDTSAGQSTPGGGLASYLRQLYIWGVAAASGLAVIMIMWGGVEYVTSAGGEGIGEAKKRIQSALLGLLLALGSYVILYTINRNFLRLDFGAELGALKVGVNKNEGEVYPETNRASQEQSGPGGISGQNPVNDSGSTQKQNSPATSNTPKEGDSGSESPLPSQPTSPDAPNPLLPPINSTPTALPGQE